MAQLTETEQYFKIRDFLAEIDFKTWLYFDNKEGKQYLAVYSSDTNNHHVVNDVKNGVQYTFWQNYNHENDHVSIEINLNEGDTVADLTGKVVSPKELLAMTKKALQPELNKIKAEAKAERLAQIERLKRELNELEGGKVA